MTDLNTIAKRLWASIPRPRVKPPKAQQSWQQLKPSQQLRSLVPIQLPGLGMCPAGTIWRVTGTDSGGCVLTKVAAEGKLVGSLRWVDKDWKRSFERERAKRRKRGGG